MANQEINDKLRVIGEKAISLLEQRTGLKLAGLPAKEIKRLVKQWERQQKKDSA